MGFIGFRIFRDYCRVLGCLSGVVVYGVYRSDRIYRELAQLPIAHSTPRRASSPTDTRRNHMHLGFRV